MSDLDDELRHRFAPRRNKRYAHLRSFEEEANWADTLDWKTNQYDFYRLFQALLARLDSEYRDVHGMRIDHLMSREELWGLARSAAFWYQQQEHYQVLGIYIYLHFSLDLELHYKATDALKARRQLGSDLSAEIHAA